METNSSGGLLGALTSIFKFITGVLLLYYFFMFILWYIKGHFSKNFIFFWAFSIVGFFICKYEHNRIENKYQEYQSKYGNKSGYELWNENMKDYDAVRGY
jgi:hypothetical protein